MSTRPLSEQTLKETFAPIYSETNTTTTKDAVVVADTEARTSFVEETSAPVYQDVYTDKADLESADVVATRAQIEETRAQLSETIDAIKDKLSPAALMEEAKEAASDKAHEMVDDLKDKASGLVGNVVEKAQGSGARSLRYVPQCHRFACPVSERDKRTIGPGGPHGESRGSES